MPRRVALVLCSPQGRVLGTLPPFDVASPWWPDVEPVVVAARERFGLTATVLRVLRTTGPGAQGGEGSYLAEIGDSDLLDLSDPDDELRRLAEHDDPLRQPWARPGGVARDVTWAEEQLCAAGRPPTGPAAQVKSWNLSCVLRIPTATGTVWCKHVPNFFAHEGAVIEAVGRDDPDLVPAVLGRRPDAGGTSVTLLADAGGVDQWDAGEPLLTSMARRWVDVQARWAADVEHLLALGLPDQRSAPLLADLTAMTRRADVRCTLARRELEALDAVVAGLPARLAAIDACGLPATLVHGDLHPGNWVGDGERLTLLDWGDSVVGHPLLDILAFVTGLEEEDVRTRVRAAFVTAWARHRPDAEVGRALQLAAQVEALRRALVYRTFLDGIEASERGYHEADVPAMLRLAISTP